MPELAGGAIDISSADETTIVTDAGGDTTSAVTTAISTEATATNTAIGVETTRAETAEGTKVTLVVAPSTASSTGVTGSVAYDATHWYVCVATNTWVRVVTATF